MRHRCDSFSDSSAEIALTCRLVCFGSSTGLCSIPTGCGGYDALVGVLGVDTVGVEISQEVVLTILSKASA